MPFSIRSAVEPIDPGLIPLYVSAITIKQYFQVARATVLAFDTMITLDKEVRFFWGTSLNSVNIVYFTNRYIGLLGALVGVLWSTYEAGFSLCFFSGWTENLSYWVTIVLIDYILVIRVLALYSQDRKLSVCLKTLLVLQAAFKLWILIYGKLHEGVTVGSLAKGVTICAEEHLPSLVWGIVDWSLPMAYGLLLMALAIYKAAEFWRISAGFAGFTLVKVLMQDQAIYFLLVVSCCALHILTLKLEVSNIILGNALQSLGSPTFLCILGSRILVNLKEAGERGLNEGTSYRLKSMSNMEFC